jgi:predicted metal-dependent phosphotriesterase family hydrolase
MRICIVADCPLQHPPWTMAHKPQGHQATLNTNGSWLWMHCIQSSMHSQSTHLTKYAPTSNKPKLGLKRKVVSTNYWKAETYGGHSFQIPQNQYQWETLILSSYMANLKHQHKNEPTIESIHRVDTVPLCTHLLPPNQESQTKHSYH